MGSLRPATLSLTLLAVAALAVGAGGYDSGFGDAPAATPSGPTTPPDAGTPSAPSAGGGGGGAGAAPPFWPTLVEDESSGRVPPDARLLVGAVLVLAGGGIALYALTGDDQRADGAVPVADEASATATTPYGSVDWNDVYRSWARLREFVDADDSTTPSELAARARAAGAPAAAVAELTDLFQRVRYGGDPATDEAERRAVAAADRATDEGTEP